MKPFTLRYVGSSKPLATILADDIDRAETIAREVIHLTDCPMYHSVEVVGEEKRLAAREYRWFERPGPLTGRRTPESCLTAGPSLSRRSYR